MSINFQNVALVPSFIHTKGEAPPSGELETLTPGYDEAHAAILNNIVAGLGCPAHLPGPDNKECKSGRDGTAAPQ